MSAFLAKLSVMERLLTIVDLLSGKGQVKTANLAQQVGVSERTLRRDILRLQNLGIDMETRPGRAGGITLKSGSLLPSLRFTENESLVLALGLNYAGSLPQTELSRAARTALRRLEQVLTEGQREKIRALHNSLPISGEASRRSLPSSETLFDLADAIKAQRRVHLRYRSTDGRVSDRPFDPYGIAEVLGHWYTAGYCHLRCEQRIFRVDRLHVLNQHSAQPERPGSYVIPPAFDVINVVSQALSKLPAGLICQVWAQTTLNHASEALPSYRTSMTPHQGGVMLTLRTETQWLNTLALNLLDLGCPLQVISPPGLQQAFHALAQRAQALGQGAVA